MKRSGATLFIFEANHVRSAGASYVTVLLSGIKQAMIQNITSYHRARRY
jgi:hypothetical protein